MPRTPSVYPFNESVDRFDAPSDWPPITYENSPTMRRGLWFLWYRSNAEPAVCLPSAQLPDRPLVDFDVPNTKRIAMQDRIS